VKTLLKQKCTVMMLPVDAVGSMVYCGSFDMLVKFWEGNKNYAHEGVFKGHKLAVLCLATTGTFVFRGSSDNTLCMWKHKGLIHMCMTVLMGHDGPLKCLATEENHEYIARGDQDKH